MYKVNYDEILGSGAFGRVYQGDKDPNNNSDLPEKIAVKDIEIKNKYCETELKVLLNYDFNFKHPNLVSIYFMSRPSKSTFRIYMEYCDRTLKQEIKERNNHKLEDKEVIYVARQILQGTEYLYNNKIIHRDLKPSNLLLKQELKSESSLLKCFVKIGDFGLSKRFESENRNTMSHPNLGSPGYRPPESCKDITPGHSIDEDEVKRRWDTTGDIWSIGKIILKIITPDLLLVFRGDGRSVSRKILSIFAVFGICQTLKIVSKEGLAHIFPFRQLMIFQKKSKTNLKYLTILHKHMLLDSSTSHFILSFNFNFI